MGFLDIFTSKDVSNAVLNQNVQFAWPRAISKHMASVALYEKKGLDSLYPDVREKAMRLIAVMANLGQPCVLNEGFRTALRQDSLFKQVPAVTKAKGLQSYHNYGLAFDMISARDGYNAPESFWRTLSVEGKKLGLISGMDFPNFPDRPHFEWHQGFTWHELELYFSTGQQ